MTTAVVWFRNDLRIHDHPALRAAVDECDEVIPLFIFDDTQLNGRFVSANRTQFLLECLEDLSSSLKKTGANLVIRKGDTEAELTKLVREANVSSVYVTTDYTPFARNRDSRIKRALENMGVELRAHPGRLAVDSVKDISTAAGTPQKVFTPFWRKWAQVERRAVCANVEKISMPTHITIGTLPKLNQLVEYAHTSPDRLKGGETLGRKRLKQFLDGPIATYNSRHNDMAADTTSRLSPYLHFGCLSIREIETMLSEGSGAAAWHRQLAWRDFYHYILLHFPGNTKREFQEKFRSLSWETDKTALVAWKDGKTGYPIVDAAMRQLLSEGWMHNRARLIVGSFLTKDLQLDWREGEAHFMEWLIDGDMANNNGNWQWITSVGVDPAPIFRRLYNPMTQQERYDPDGTYVKRYVPELENVPTKYLAKPWEMSEEQQEESHCVIGKDYPKPIVDHASARQATLERYRRV